jgi:flagellar protein FlaJ
MTDTISESTEQVTTSGKVNEPKARISGFHALSVRLFSKYTRKINGDYLEKLQLSLNKANIPLFSDEYISAALLWTVIDIVIFVILWLLSILLKLGLGFEIITIMLIPTTVLATVLSLIEFPDIRARTRERLIDSNLYSAMTFIAAMAEADVPVDLIFKELAGRKEYGEVAIESGKIARNTEILGMDIFTSIYLASKESPSVRWQSFLQGAVTTATTGGRLKPYFISRAREYQNSMTLVLKKSLDEISLFAEVYVTVGVAFPLFLIVILAVMGVVAHPVTFSVEYFLMIFSFIVVPVIIASFIWMVGSMAKEAPA